MANSPQPLDLEAILATHLFVPLPASTVNDILSKSPFIQTTSVFNLRSLPPPVRENYIFRSGSLECINQTDYQIIHDLGIRTIFDLRSLAETADHPTRELPGIAVKWVPSTEYDHTLAANKQDPSRFSVCLVRPLLKLPHPDDDQTKFLALYMNLLSTHADAYKSVIEHIRDHPDSPFLFHCTAGKDRTGVLAFLLLSLAGADPTIIDHDYALTRVGIEPARDLLEAKLAGAMNLDKDDPVTRKYFELPNDAMQQLRRQVEAKYGGNGVEGYVRKELGLSDEDLAIVKSNLKGH